MARAAHGVDLKPERTKVSVSSTTGFDFSWVGGAPIENTTIGVTIRKEGNTTRANTILNNRFEPTSTNIAIESGVQMTGLLFNR